MPDRTPTQIADDAQQVLEQLDVLAAALRARKESAASIAAYIENASDAALQRAENSRKAAKKALAEAAKSPSEADAQFAIAKEVLEGAKVMADRAKAGSAGEHIDEWKECRQAIGRFDQALVDLRKIGIGLITALIGATALLLPRPPEVVPPNADAPALASLPDVKFIVLTVIIGLIVALYLMDRFHQILQRAAVERATELEALMGFKLTRALSNSYGRLPAEIIAVIIYAGLVLAVGFLFGISGASSDTILWASISYQCATIGVSVLGILSLIVFTRAASR